MVACSKLVQMPMIICCNDDDYIGNGNYGDDCDDDEYDGDDNLSPTRPNGCSKLVQTPMTICCNNNDNIGNGSDGGDDGDGDDDEYEGDDDDDNLSPMRPKGCSKLAQTPIRVNKRERRDGPAIVLVIHDQKSQ